MIDDFFSKLLTETKRVEERNREGGRTYPVIGPVDACRPIA